ncbi:hypothetical protein CRM22_009186 [Opisthorchis felineus]|uniref:Centrosomal protein of 85 kDa-like CC4 coiled-coil domain-containing protein n=1 Tax=Opisthorchis felineus TaxID=147828 RepID=A0A4V3SD51_OPIFE|nr:hypothetical protein CRM22_009186 [Opisthorchis felineus]
MEYEGRATEVELLQQRVDELTWLLNEREKSANLELGSVEYELEQCKEAHAKVCVDYEAKLGAAVKENECLQHQLAEAQNSLESYRLTVRDKTERLKQLESYLAQLPTTEEHSEVAKQLSVAQQRTTDLEKQTNKTKGDLERLESRLAETMAKLKRSHEREELLQTQLDCAMQRLQIKTPSNGGNPSVDLGLKSTRVTPEFVEDLKFEVDRYRTAFEQAKKLLEAETHRAEGLAARQKMEKRQFKEQLAREEATVAGLKATLSSRKSEINQLKEYISKLNSEKQDLLDRLLCTHSSLSKAVEAWHSTGGHRRLRFLHDLKASVREAVCLSNHLCRLASGEKLDLSSLLFQPQTPADCYPPLCENEGRKLSPTDRKLSECNKDLPTNPCLLPTIDIDFDDSLADEDIHCVQDAKETLIGLRQKLADRYADHLGGKIDCSVQ